MHPTKVDRSRLKNLTDLPNIGKASAADLVLLGYLQPSDLIGADPLQMYHELCLKTGVRHDPCVIDVFMSVTRFMNGEPPRLWWDFTDERKQLLSKIA